MSSSIINTWILIGDFNDIISEAKKKGGARINMTRFNIFYERINICNLIEFHFVGSKFTWRGPKNKGYERLFEKLDRAFYNVVGRTHYHEAFVKVLTCVDCLDHHPFLLMIDGMPFHFGIHPFGFEAAWLTHESFDDLIRHHLVSDNHICENLDVDEGVERLE